MRPSECELSKLVVVKARKPPVGDVVARFAAPWETCRAVIDGLGRLILLLMAIEALGTQASIYARSRSPMTGIARDGGVSPKQGKPIQVVLGRLRGHAPSADRVAVLALGSHLPAMKVRMTVRAFGSSVGKNSGDVARITGYILVHAPQRKRGLIVIELRLRTQRRPTRGRMTVLARNRNRAVGIARSLGLALWAEPQPESH